jgi:peptidoglycan biosynthesis protein MviN/MurJ (putative lipid II flippase)
MGKIGLGKIVRSFLKSLGASLLMGAVALIISLQGEWQQSGVTVEKIALLGGAIAAAIAVYGVTSFFLGSEELGLVVAGVRRRLKLQKR